MNIFENFIPRELITCNNKDFPWMNKQIKILIAEKTLYQRLKQRMLNSKLLDKLGASTAKLQRLINFFHFFSLPSRLFLFQECKVVPPAKC